MNDIQVNTYTNSRQHQPSVATLSDGKFAVVWTSNGQDGSLGGIYRKVFFSNGTAFNNNDYRINEYVASEQSEAVISPLNGKFVVVWSSNGQDGSLQGIYAAILTNNNEIINSDIQVNTYTNSQQHQPSVATLSDGKFAVVWTSNGQDGSLGGIYRKVFFSNGTAFSNNDYRINEYVTSDQSQPMISALNNKFVVVWSSNGQDESLQGVYAAILTNNNEIINSDIQVNTYTNSQQYQPSVATLSDDKFVVVWTSNGQDGSLGGIYRKVFFSNGTAFSNNDYRINEYVTSDQSQPMISALNNKFVVVWSSNGQDESLQGVYAAILTNNNEIINSDIQVNTYTNSQQYQPSVATLSDDKFVVVWTSNGQDGSLGGIYLQIFYSNGTKYPYEEVTTTVAPTTLLVTTVVPTTTTITTPAPPPSTTTTTEMPTTTTLSPDTTAAPTTLIPPTAPVGVSPSSDAFNAQMDNSIFVSGIALCGVIMGEFLL